MTATLIDVEGMTCKSCVANIEKSLTGKEGIEDIAVSLDKKVALAFHNPDVVTAENVAKMITDVGFKAAVRAADESRIKVKGMHCQSCVKNIQLKTGKMEGVHMPRVFLDKELAVILHDKTAVSAEALAEKIKELGFETTIE